MSAFTRYLERNKIPPTRPEKILKAMELLEECGLVIRDLYAKQEFIYDARTGRQNIDDNGMFGCHRLDTEFADWVDKKNFGGYHSMSTEAIGTEGMMYGIRFRRLI